jgi:hypothetical protein
VRGCRCEKLRKWIWKEGLLLLSLEPVYGNDDLMVFTKTCPGRAITWGISPFDSHFVEGLGTDQMVQVYTSIQSDHQCSQVINSLGNNIPVR